MKRFILSLCALSFIMTSCEDDNSDTSSNQNNPDTPVVVDVLLTNNSTFGNIITDTDGNTLYFFSKDTKDTSECNGGCAEAWPIFYKAELTLGEGLDANNFGVITRQDGSKQNTYKGWPLYYFANDAATGDTNGDGVTGNWFVAKPDYSLMLGQATLDADDLEFYFTSSTGRTIYSFGNDERNNNNFTNEDFSNNSVWPIVEISPEVLPSALNTDDFGTIDVFGRTQLTFKGRPLYYFGNDTERGDANGVSGVWPRVNNDTTAL